MFIASSLFLKLALRSIAFKFWLEESVEVAVGIICLRYNCLFGSVDPCRKLVFFSIMDEKPLQKLSPNYFLSGLILEDFSQVVN